MGGGRWSVSGRQAPAGTVLAVIRWSDRGDTASGAAYDTRWRCLESLGESIHGEADLVAFFEPASVLDAGSGTGRVAVELDRRDIAVVGVDLDPGMLDVARRKAPHVTWIRANLVDVTVADAGGRRRGFDVVVMAGNVMIFLEPASEAAVVANMAGHLIPGGRLISGFQLGSQFLTLADYDRFAAGCGLTLEHRWSTWDRRPFEAGNYAVSVHRAEG